MPQPIRLLLLGDTHLGFDDPQRPRVCRRRRGPDFFASFVAALAPARRREVDVVLHGGDVFHTPRVPMVTVDRALIELHRVADAGVPIVVLAGNHERSRLPFMPLLARHPLLTLVERPTAVALDVRGVRLAIHAFPFVRRVGAGVLPGLLRDAGLGSTDADVHIGAMHQTVEGATVGAQDYVFRAGRDIIPGRDVPAGLAALLSGHIHRSQVLEADLAGRPLAAPVVYAGSTERTSFQEREEVKGYRLVELAAGGPGRPGPGGRLVGTRVVPLATRPMAVIQVAVAGRPPDDVRAELRRRLGALPPDAVVRVRTRTPDELEAAPPGLLGAPALRALAPASMTISGPRPRLRGSADRARPSRTPRRRSPGGPDPWGSWTPG